MGYNYYKSVFLKHQLKPMNKFSITFIFILQLGLRLKMIRWGLNLNLFTTLCAQFAFFDLPLFSNCSSRLTLRFVHLLYLMHIWMWMLIVNPLLLACCSMAVGVVSCWLSSLAFMPIQWCIGFPSIELLVCLWAITIHENPASFVVAKIMCMCNGIYDCSASQ